MTEDYGTFNGQKIERVSGQVPQFESLFHGKIVWIPAIPLWGGGLMYLSKPLKKMTRRQRAGVFAIQRVINRQEKLARKAMKDYPYVTVSPPFVGIDSSTGLAMFDSSK